MRSRRIVREQQNTLVNERDSPWLWARLVGLVKVVVESVWFDDDDECFVVSVRSRKGARRRCGKCAKRCPGYDQGEGRRCWRALDLGTIKAFLEADSPRMACPDHGVVAVQVPWARHGVGYTYAFDDSAAWLVTHCSKSAVGELLRIAWRTVGSIVSRVVADADAETDRFANLRRIGIDEISYKRGHRFLTVVVDHDSGCCCGCTRAETTRRLEKFFDRLGEQRCADITRVSADAAEWIATVVTARCLNAELCLDPMLLLLSSGSFGGMSGARHEDSVDVSGDVSLEAPHGFSPCLAFADPPMDVVACGLVPSESD